MKSRLFTWRGRFCSRSSRCWSALWLRSSVLLRLDNRECMAQAFVLDHCSMGCALIFEEGAIGKHVAVPSGLRRPVCGLLELHVFAGKLFGGFVPFQDDLPASYDSVSCAPT